MVTTILAHVKGGVIIPDSPINLPDGAEVRLQFDGLAANLHDDRPSIFDVLNSTPPPGLFKTSAEVDEYIDNERDSWGD